MNGHKAGIASRTGAGTWQGGEEGEARKERGQGIAADDIRESCPNPCVLFNWRNVSNDQIQHQLVLPITGRQRVNQSVQSPTAGTSDSDESWMGWTSCSCKPTKAHAVMGVACRLDPRIAGPGTIYSEFALKRGEKPGVKTITIG
ncbi:hypothetical protein H4582DRAFT_2062099 [Lactarius indigo]|nr:hypothetical protein H4582DRAFT_2062099 [Lactarius indigo]